MWGFQMPWRFAGTPGVRELEIQPGVGIRFNENDAGRVVSFSTVHPGGEVDRPKVVRRAKKPAKPAGPLSQKERRRVCL